MKLSSQTVVALVVGISCGLMWGEFWGQFSWIGQVFIKLLQMSVLPYIVVALVTGIGRTDKDDALKLIKKPMAVYAAIWLLSCAVIGALLYCFPVWEFANHFTPTQTLVDGSFNLIDVFIPANPFHSLANSVVPAVVFFSICVGVALINKTGKESLLEPMSQIQEALSSVAYFVAKLTPVGVFFITADAAGTMTFDQMSRIQVFILAFMAGSVLLTYVLLPTLCSLFTGIRVAKIIRPMAGCVITAFAVDNLFVVLPLIIEAAKSLKKEIEPDAKWDLSAITVVASIAFVFPGAGKILRLLFIPFAAWDSDVSFGFSELVQLSGAGLFSMFGSPHVAIPFLLDMFHIPVDQYRLYLMARLVTSRFGEAIGAMSIFCLVVAGTFSSKGLFREYFSFCIRGLIYSGVSIVLILGGTHVLFNNILKKPDLSANSILAKELLTDQAKVLDAAQLKMAYQKSGVKNLESLPVLERVRRTGVIRVGIDQTNLPFSFINRAGHLVGFDVENAHRLAVALGADLYFSPAELNEVQGLFANQRIDIYMSGVSLSADIYEYASMINPHLDSLLSLLVPDHDRQKYASWFDLEQVKGKKIAVYKHRFVLEKLRRVWPGVELQFDEKVAAVVEGLKNNIDIVVMSAEVAYSLASHYPDYHVVTPEPQVSLPMGYLTRPDQYEFVSYVNNLILVSKGLPEYDLAHKQWIEGQNIVQQHRWSVWQDVLGM